MSTPEINEKDIDVRPYVRERYGKFAEQSQTGSRTNCG